MSMPIFRKEILFFSRVLQIMILGNSDVTILKERIATGLHFPSTMTNTMRRSKILLLFILIKHAVGCDSYLHQKIFHNSRFFSESRGGTERLTS